MWPASSRQSSFNEAHGETGTMINTDSWLEWFLGADEPTIIKNKERFRDTSGEFVNVASNRRWPAGRFLYPSVAELQARVNAALRDGEWHRPEDLPCPLTIVDDTDIGVLQADLTSEQKAMVQIASNFNCLENASSRIAADYGHLVDGYATDSTQGPAASFGVPAASLLRAHYCFEDRARPSSDWGQHEGHEVELLGNIAEFVGRCENGKLVLRGDETPVTEELVDMVAENVRVGIHEDAQVVFKRGRRAATLEVVPSPPVIDQVLSASANWRNLGVRPSQKQLTLLTRSLLRASYDGAYLAAIRRERELLLLTLIGGASFGNPIDLILEELQRAHDRWALHPRSRLREVRLVLYPKGVAEEFRCRFTRKTRF